MTKHDRLMKALEEIKDICAKSTDTKTGCSNKCPFLTGTDDDNYRPCEVLHYVDGYTPDAWGSDNG